MTEWLHFTSLLISLPHDPQMCPVWFLPWDKKSYNFLWTNYMDKFCQCIKCLKEYSLFSWAYSLYMFKRRLPVMIFKYSISSVQFSHSVMSDSLRPHEPQYARPPCPSPIPESTQTHVHWVGDAIQPSYPLSSPSPPALNLSQHQGLFKWVSSSHQVAKVLEFQLQHQSFQWTPRTDLL